ncbi:MAG: CoA transferase, partial [Xanthobacteraceae bacterium]
MLPLAGVRVLDLTSVVVGPAATLRLADLGAEIIKVEAPEGDLLRTLGGPSHSGSMSGKFLHFNRDKKFVCLNLRSPEGLTALRRILAGCDVLLTNIRPDALARMKLDAKTCRAEKPDLIHCSITGFGPGGPYRGKPAYDTVLQAASGLAGLSIERDGEPNFAPFLAVDHVVGE